MTRSAVGRENYFRDRSEPAALPHPSRGGEAGGRGEEGRRGEPSAASPACRFPETPRGRDGSSHTCRGPSSLTPASQDQLPPQAAWPCTPPPSRLPGPAPQQLPGVHMCTRLSRQRLRRSHCPHCTRTRGALRDCPRGNRPERRSTPASPQCAGQARAGQPRGHGRLHLRLRNFPSSQRDTVPSPPPPRPWDPPSPLIRPLGASHEGSPVLPPG